MNTPEFWAKTSPDGNPGISVLEHMLNVGCVAQKLAEIAEGLLARFHLQPAEVAALAGLHDLGKISPGFQRKCDAWIVANDLVTVVRNNVWDTTTESDHAKVTQAAVQELLIARKMPRKSASLVATLLGAHHGRIKHAPDDRGWRIQGGSESASGIAWEAIRNETANLLIDCFGAELANVALREDSPALWWLAGLTTIADWIGSDERYFSAEGGLKQSDRVDSASRALSEIGFGAPTVLAGLSFSDAFGFSSGVQPNDMQRRALEAIVGPGVYVIEAPMGMGKTEAALWAAYKLLEKGGATGIYFALPTQATSNRMHLRMADFLSRTVLGANRARLIHGNSWLLENSVVYSPTATSSAAWQDDARVGRDWFHSAKRALLAPFGVGTVDQALLGVVSAKHFFVRHFALAGKVVILDEVHSYDLYTGTLIDKLVKTLDGLGCIVIILSATLTKARREKLFSGQPRRQTDDSGEHYPLISGVGNASGEIQIAAEAPVSRDVEVQFEAHSDLQQQAIALANRGGVVLWVCNTVAAAQATYRALSSLVGPCIVLGLLHSRYPFWRRETLEAEWMDRLGKEGASRCGCILVSTQIVEQSVDLDADLLITELAPTDMLLQRMGRLWRHSRGIRPVAHPRICILKESKSLQELQELSPKAIIEALGAKAFVYFPYVLLRSLMVWSNRPVVSIPDEIRMLIESTYAVLDVEPPAWQKLFDEGFAKDLGKKFLATSAANLWNVPLEDVEGVQTRLNEQPAVSIVLCKKLSAKLAVFLDDSEETVASDDFRLRTAKAIHRNLVRVPKHRFARTVRCKAFAEYLYGDQAVGIVTDSGAVQIEGLKDGVSMHWDVALGITIEVATRGGEP